MLRTHGRGDLRFVAYELLGGGLLLGAFFMATDYATSRLITAKGRMDFRHRLRRHHHR